jgi:uncharacterized tellurite resistance protein B-like protein
MAEYLKGLVEAVREYFDQGRKDENNQLLEAMDGGDQITPELAYTVLLVDLAMIDQDFDEREYAYLMTKLEEKFGLDKEEIVVLIEQAKRSVEGFRGPKSMVDYLRDHLSVSEKQGVMALIDGLIEADQVKDDAELHLKEAFKALLGLKG